jgi:epoxide hydrolase-like predicted phosphatase
VGDRQGLILDYGGVLTSSPFASFEAFCAAEGLARGAVRDRFRDDVEARALLARLETGELAAAEFEPAFAALLEVSSERLLQRMFGGMQPDTAMIDGVRAIHRTGVRIGLLSNSVGDAAVYDRALLAELFDGWVISSEVGLRKPDPAIYALAAERIGLPATACIYVDDLPGNLKPAAALGMATVLHRGDAPATLAEVQRLLRQRNANID